MIDFRDVTKVYEGGVTGVSHLSFHVDDGEFVYIVGESGSGKSTLLKLMMRELKATRGALLIDGKDITKYRRSKVAELRRGMGIVFQDYRLLPRSTVYENVAFAMEVIEAPAKKIRRSVPAALNLVGLFHKANSLPSEISGGEQQRTAIARAIVNNPSIVIADEPTGNLDPRNSEEIMDVLESINRHGTTVLMATHNKEIVDEYQHRVIHLVRGRIVRDSLEGGYDDED